MILLRAVPILSPGQVANLVPQLQMAAVMAECIGILMQLLLAEQVVLVGGAEPDLVVLRRLVVLQTKAQVVG